MKIYTQGRAEVWKFGHRVEVWKFRPRAGQKYEGGVQKIEYLGLKAVFIKQSISKNAPL